MNCYLKFSLFISVLENNKQLVLQENWAIEKGKLKASSHFIAEILAYVEVNAECNAQFRDNPFLYYMNL